MPDILFENVDSILDEFRDLEDPRSPINQQFPVKELDSMPLVKLGKIGPVGRVAFRDPLSKYGIGSTVATGRH
jgi:hypothetical protein